MFILTLLHIISNLGQYIRLENCNRASDFMRQVITDITPDNNYMHRSIAVVITYQPTLNPLLCSLAEPSNGEFLKLLCKR